MTHTTDMHGKPTPRMTTGEWRQHLIALCADCAEAQGGEEDGLLRRAHGLLAAMQDAGGYGPLVDHLPPRAGFDALLRLGAHDSAAMALMPETANYLISRAGDGSCLASVVLPGMAEEMTSEGESPALALISALAAALAAVAVTLDTAVGFDGAGPCARDAGGDHGAPDVFAAEALGAFDRGGWQRPAGTRLH